MPPRLRAVYPAVWRLERALKHIEMGKVFSRPLQAVWALAGVAFAFALFFGGGLEEGPAVSGPDGASPFSQSRSF